MKKRKAKAPPRQAKAKPKPAQAELALQETRRISEIIVRDRHRKAFGDLAALAASINDRGTLLQPIVITPENELIAGERRLRAWPLTKFKNDPIPVHVVSIDSIVAGEWDENAARKDFTPAEAVAIKRALVRQLGPAALERKRAGKKADPKLKGQAADQAARVVGFDRRTIEKAEKIVDAAAAEPDRFGPLLEQMNKDGKVNGPFRRLEVLIKAGAIRAEPPPLPMRGPYRTLVADVPWPGELEDEDPAGRGRAFFPYATMALEAIAAMGEQIKAICHPDGAWLWFWIPNFHLMHAAHLPILKSWGFTPRGLRTWIKPHFGNGKIFRGQTEQVMLCSRGTPAPLVLTNLSTKLEGAPSAQHSGKPAAFFADVEAHTPAPRFAYLFAGYVIPDRWDGHGDRVGKISPVEARAAESFFLAECDRVKIAGAAPPPAAAESAPAQPSVSIDKALELVDRGAPIADIDPDLVDELRAFGLIKGAKKLRLTADGHDRLRAARERDAQIDIEELIEKGGQDGTNEIRA